MDLVELRQILAELIADGLIETFVVDGQVRYRATAGALAAEARERSRRRPKCLREIEDCVSLGYLEPAGHDPDGRRRWLITEAGEPEFLTEEQRAEGRQWYFVQPAEPN